MRKSNYYITRRIIGLSVLLSVTFFAFASIGDGKVKSKKATSAKTSFSPLKSNNGFTLKSGFNYRGSMLFISTKTKKVNIPYNSLITYQKGNSTFILPYRYKLPTSSRTNIKSSLQLINLKLTIPR
jgi:hypothetical protein